MSTYQAQNLSIFTASVGFLLCHPRGRRGWGVQLLWGRVVIGKWVVFIKRGEEAKFVEETISASVVESLRILVSCFAGNTPVILDVLEIFEFVTGSPGLSSRCAFCVRLPYSRSGDTLAS